MEAFERGALRGLLCYEERPPLLRVLELASMDVREWPTPWDDVADGAIACVCRRRGYLVLHQVGRDGAIAMPADLANPGRLLPPSTYTAVPALSPDHVWLCNPEGREHGRPHEARAVDREGAVVREVVVPGGGTYLRAESTAGLVVEVEGGAGCYLLGGSGELGRQLTTGGSLIGVLGGTVVWEDKPGRPPFALILAAIVGPPHPDVAAWRSKPATLHLDALDGSGRHELVHPEIAEWRSVLASPSPSGAMAAIPFRSTVAKRCGLAVVDVGTREIRVADGEIEASSGPPVWSPDERAIYLGQPAKRRIAVVTVETMAMGWLPIAAAPMPIAAL